jgi:hypothetical protein
VCVIYKNKMTWYCPTCDDTMVCFGAYFVKLHNNYTYIVTLVWDETNTMIG